MGGQAYANTHQTSERRRNGKWLLIHHHRIPQLEPAKAASTLQASHAMKMAARIIFLQKSVENPSDESLPLWISRRTERPLFLYARHGSTLSQQAVGAAAGPHRSAPDGCTRSHDAESCVKTRRRYSHRRRVGCRCKRAATQTPRLRECLPRPARPTPAL